MVCELCLYKAVKKNRVEKDQVYGFQSAYYRGLCQSQLSGDCLQVEAAG